VHRRRGYTLIELLVVIAIVALLMAILSPSLAQARRRARAVACQVNLQQWSVVLSMYTNEHDGPFFEGTVPEGVEDSARGRWMDALRWYYTDQPKIRCCPMAAKTQYELNSDGVAVLTRGRGTFVAWGIFDGSGWTTNGDYGSYGLNRWVTNPLPGVKPRGRPTEYNWRTCEVQHAMRIPLFLDCHWVGGWPEEHSNEPPEYDGDWEGKRVNNIKRFCLNRHDGAINGLFLDWSTRKLGLKKLWKLKWHRKYDTNAEPPVWPDWMRNFKDY